MQALNLPNTLTAARIVLIPVFITALEYRKYDYALYVFFFAAVTDLLDGLIARIKKQKTQLGAILDPLADKFMLVTGFVFFAFYGWIPPWLTIIVISRDIIIVTGWTLLYVITHRLKVEPSVLGKVSTTIQSVLLCYVLLNVNFPFIPSLENVLIGITAFITGLSGLHYIFRGFRLASEK
jgi:cardiolipin synthase